VITGIIVALPEELITLTKLKIKQGECKLINNRLLIAYSGTGAKNAQSAAKLLIETGATGLISWGCAAALIPELNSGDLILPKQLVSHQQQILQVNERWLKQLQNTLKPEIESYEGQLAESLEMVTTQAAKQQLQQQTTAIAVDMESVAMAEVATKNNLPFLVIRTIADTVFMDLPQAISYALDEQGQVQLSRLLFFILTHPQEIPALIKLGLHFNKAQNKLKAVAKHLDTIIDFE